MARDSLLTTSLLQVDCQNLLSTGLQQVVPTSCNEPAVTCTRGGERYSLDIHFSTSAERHKINDSRDIKLARDKSDSNLKILNFNMGFTSYRTCLESLKNHNPVDSVIYFSHNRLLILPVSIVASGKLLKLTNLFQPVGHLIQAGKIDNCSKTVASVVYPTRST